MKNDRHPDPLINRMIDEAADEIARRMTPLQKGLTLYPDAEPRTLDEVPRAVIDDHLDRYTRQDLEEGQFLEVSPGKYTFIMAHRTKKRKSQESDPENKQEECP